VNNFNLKQHATMKLVVVNRCSKVECLIFPFISGWCQLHERWCITINSKLLAMNANPWPNGCPQLLEASSEVVSVWKMQGTIEALCGTVREILEFSDVSSKITANKNVNFLQFFVKIRKKSRLSILRFKLSFRLLVWKTCFALLKTLR